MYWLLFLSLILPLPPANSCVTLYAQYGVKGRAKSVVETIYRHSPASGALPGDIDTVAPQTVLFSRSGDSAVLQLHSHNFSRHSGWSIIYHDSSGRIVNERFSASFHANDSSPSSSKTKHIYRYSPDCLLEEEYSVDSYYGAVPSIITYVYDSTSRLAKIVSKNHHDTLSVSVVRNEYLPSGGRIERFHLAARNGREYRGSRAYDSAGNLMEEIAGGESRQGPTDTAMRTRYSYDNHGDLVLSEQYRFGQRRASTRTEYIHDDRGSWTECRIYARDSDNDPDYRLAEVRKRRIEYYPE